ncbi:hypothetical protein KC338_g319 [Hortaea werneckii]|nr:hypothetical protein KC338_g319 [Hortaea werneckii]
MTFRRVAPASKLKTASASVPSACSLQLPSPRSYRFIWPSKTSPGWMYMVSFRTIVSLAMGNVVTGKGNLGGGRALKSPCVASVLPWGPSPVCRRTTAEVASPTRRGEAATNSRCKTIRSSVNFHKSSRLCSLPSPHMPAASRDAIAPLPESPRHGDGGTVVDIDIPRIPTLARCPRGYPWRDFLHESLLGLAQCDILEFDISLSELSLLRIVKKFGSFGTATATANPAALKGTTNTAWYLLRGMSDLRSSAQGQWLENNPEPISRSHGCVEVSYVAQAPKLALVVAMDTLGLEQSLRLLKTTEVNHEASTGASWMKSFILSIAICEGDVRWPHDCRAALMVSWTNWLFFKHSQEYTREHYTVLSILDEDPDTAFQHESFKSLASIQLMQSRDEGRLFMFRDIFRSHGLLRSR